MLGTHVYVLEYHMVRGEHEQSWRGSTYIKPWAEGAGSREWRIADGVGDDQLPTCNCPCASGRDQYAYVRDALLVLLPGSELADATAANGMNTRNEHEGVNTFMLPLGCFRDSQPSSDR